MATRIELYDVPRGADEAFLADWERARHAGSDVGTVALHRALSPDAAFRYVEVARLERTRSGAYEVVREHGDVDGAGGTAQITAHDVPAGADARFLAGWDAWHEALAPRQGHIGARLHRSLDPAALRYVTVRRWSSPLMVARAAQRPDARRASEALAFPAHAALYEVVRR